MSKRYRFSSIDADYYQFHLHDAEAESTLAEAWTPEALARNVAVAPFIVGVGTKRNTSVWLDIEQHDIKPSWQVNRHWLHVVECSLDLPSGHLVVSSPTLEAESHKHIFLAPGCYRLRIHFGKQQNRGIHRYKVSLWQEKASSIVLLKSA